MNRRHFLTVLGTGAIITAAGGAGYTGFAMTRTPHKALKPWQQAGSGETPIIRALSWAILAPNPHNRQPWQVDLHNDMSATLYCQTDRKLPHTDPFDRQITIGLGCFLEQLRLAASLEGLHADIQLFPQGVDETHLDNRPVARINLEKGNAKNNLADYLAMRRTNREAHNPERPVSRSELDALKNIKVKNVMFNGTNDPKHVSELNDLSMRAFETEMRTPRTYLESAELMRIGKAEINANPDGIAMSGTFFETLKLLGLISYEAMQDPKGSGPDQGLDAILPVLQSSMAHLWIMTSGNSRIEQVNAGAAYLQANLTATKLGIAMQPLSQALQEYPEMTDLYAEAKEKLGANPKQTVQMWARIGYAKQVEPAPRWPLNSRIINT